MKETAATKREGFLPWFRHMWATYPLFNTAIALLVMVVLRMFTFGFKFDSFGVWFSIWLRNWIDILRSNTSVGIIALGIASVIVSGGINLSVGSSLVTVSATIMMLIDSDPRGFLYSMGISGSAVYVPAVLVGVLAGRLLGELNGVLVTSGKTPPFIVTLGIMKIFRGVTQQYMQGGSPSVPSDFLEIVNVSIGGQMLMPIVYWLLISAVPHIVPQRTASSRHVAAVGSNERAAKLPGIPVNRVKRRAYVLMGMLVASSAVLQVSCIGSMDYANAGSGYEMDTIATATVGGTNMAGGCGSILGTVFGMLIISTMNSLLNLMGVPPFLRKACKGIIVIGVVLLQKKESTS